MFFCIVLRNLFQECPQGVHECGVFVKPDKVPHIGNVNDGYFGVQLANFRDDFKGHDPSKLWIGGEEQ